VARELAEVTSFHGRRVVALDQARRRAPRSPWPGGQLFSRRAKALGHLI
jgi:hypothetical protein